jgi:hypothetical protein
MLPADTDKLWIVALPKSSQYGIVIEWRVPNLSLRPERWQEMHGDQIVRTSLS